MIIQKYLASAVLFTIAKTQKQPKCPWAGERIKKMWCVCVCVWNISHKKECNNAICSNIDRPRDYHTK